MTAPTIPTHSELRAKALAATQGRWRSGPYGSVHPDADGSGAICVMSSKSGFYDNWNANAVFIAAANPETVLSLISTIERQAEEIAALREVLEECEVVLALSEQPAFPDPLYHEGVKALGERIGFGALMSTASAGWRETLSEKDYPLGGEFVAGPCYATVIKTLGLVRSALSHAKTKEGT